MFILKRVIQFFVDLFEVKKEERLTLTLLWSMVFLLAFGGSVGFTQISALFLKQVGVNFLPYQFLAYAIIGLIGTLAYTAAVKKLSHKLQFIITSLVSALFIIAPWFLVVGQDLIPLEKLIPFFVLIFVADAAILGHLSIQIWRMIETFYTPNQRKRLYPIITTSGLIGSMAAGSLIGFFVKYLGFNNLILVWAASLLLLIPLVLVFNRKNSSVFAAENEKKEKKHKNLKEQIENIRQLLSDKKYKDVRVELEEIRAVFPKHETVKQLLEQLKALEKVGPKTKKRGEYDFVKKHAFIRLMLFLLTVKWLVLPILELQFNKIVDMSFPDQDSLAIFFGRFSLALSAAILIFQIFLGKRVISSLGVPRSMLVLPILMVLGFSGLTLSFTFWVAITMYFIIALINSTIQDNSYQMTYSIYPSGMTFKARNFIENIWFQIVTFVSSLILVGYSLLISTNIVSEQIGVWILNFSGIIISIGYLIYSIRIRSQYSSSLIQNTRYHEKQLKENAIEALSEPSKDPEISQSLVNIIKKDSEHIETRIKAIMALSEIGNFNIIPDILDVLERGSETMKIKALVSLKHFRGFSKHIDKYPFIKYRILKLYEDIFVHGKSQRVKKVLLHSLDNINFDEMAGFLVQALKQEDRMVQANVVEALGYFHDKGIVYYLEPFMYHIDPAVKEKAFIGLWQFKEMRLEIVKSLIFLLSNPDPKMVCSALNIIGELQMKFEEKFALQKFQSDDSDDNVKLRSGIALLKLDNTISTPYIAEVLCRPEKTDEEGALRVADLLNKKIPNRVYIDLTQKLLARNESELKVAIENLKASVNDHRKMIEKLEASEEIEAKRKMAYTVAT